MMQQAYDQRPADGQQGYPNSASPSVGDMLAGKERMAGSPGVLPQADAVVIDQCVLWKQYMYSFSYYDHDNGDHVGKGTEAHFRVEFADARGRTVRCWTDGTPYLCSQVRRGDRMTVWYVPDEDVSRVRVVRAVAEGDAGEGRSPYTKRVGEGSFFAIADMPPSKVSEEELWCEPGTFGGLAPHSGWGGRVLEVHAAHVLRAVAVRQRRQSRAVHGGGPAPFPERERAPRQIGGRRHHGFRLLFRSAGSSIFRPT